MVRGTHLLIDAMPQRPADRDDMVWGNSFSTLAPFRVVSAGNSDKVRSEDFVDTDDHKLSKK